MPTLTKYAVRFILNGKSRTYLLNDIGTSDAICSAIDLLEIDVPDIGVSRGIAVIVKPFPDGAHLAEEGDGPLIDTTREAIAREPEREALAA